MVTKNQIKLVVSLKQKKYRSQHGLFVVEGEKLVNELLNSGFKTYQIFVDDTGLVQKFEQAEVVPAKTLKQMSSLTHPSGILGVFRVKDSEALDLDAWVVVLDAVRDPGNMGTIIRLCDWFGIKRLVCSTDTVDCYNPKVLQATMGSIARVNVYYTNLEETIKNLPNKFPIYWAFMDGKNISDFNLENNTLLVMGSESFGISKKVSELISEKIAIKREKKGAESLNVAIATSILLYEFKRSN